MSLTPVGDLGIALKADIDDYQKSMATASDLTAGFRGTVRNLASAVRNMGAAMTVGAGLAGAALVTLTQRAERVSSAFREVDTLVQGTSDAQEKYGQLVTDLNTKFGLQADKLEVIEGLYQSVSAGVKQSTEAQREFLSTAAKLAVVGRVELGVAVDVLSTVMNTYGYEASQAKNISETLFQTVQFGKTRMEELAPVLGRVAALGSNLGVQIDEIGASMAVLTRTGFGARVAATGLRNMFRAMLKPSEKMQEVLFQIASEQDFFAAQMGSSEKRVRELANEYRNASDAVQKFAEKQAAARATQESASTAIQEARLKITAAEQGRLDQLPKLTNEQVRNANSIKELKQIIEDYQFKVNKARLQEEKFRKQKKEQKKALEGYQSKISDIIATNGDLQGGIGQLILENQNFVDTMVALREKVNKTGASMSDIFPRTRALQGALALVGEEGQMLTEIFKQMEEGGFDAAKMWEKMDESTKKNFNSFKEFKQATEDVSAGDLQETFEKAQGPQQKLRNSISKLREAMSGLGQVFTKDVVDSIAKFANKFTTLVEKFENMDKKVRENISRFTVLAVAIGLVLGPLMFFGGQLAIIASTMGTMFIPVAVFLAGVLGIFASALSTAASEGKEAEGLFTSMQGTFKKLINFVMTLKNHFIGVLLPAFKFLGHTFIEIFNEIKSQFAESESLEGFDNLIFRVAWALREGVVAIGEFLKNNKELIANLVVLAVDTVVNKIIPAVIDFANKLRTEMLPVLMDVGDKAQGELIPALVELAKGIYAVVMNIDFGAILKLAASFVVLLPIIADIVTWLGKFLQNNAELIGTLITLAAKVAIVGIVLIKFLGILGSIAATLGPLITAVTAFWGSLSGLGLGAKLTFSALKLLSVVITRLVTLFPLAAKGVGVLYTGLSYLVSGLAVVASAIGISVSALVGLIAIFGLVAAAAWIARDEIVAGFWNTWNTLKRIGEIIYNFFTSDLSMAEAGKKIVTELAKGMMNGISILKQAAGKVAGVITDFFPSSPAKTGPLSKNPPADSGKKITKGYAKGILSGKGEAEDASGEIASALSPDESQLDFGVDMSKKDFFEKYSDTESYEGEGYSKENLPEGSFPGKGKGMGMNMGGETYEVTFTEGSIEVGPFHGISDEELPAKVRKEVNRSLQDVIDEVKGSGKDATSSMAPGGQSGL